MTSRLFEKGVRPSKHLGGGRSIQLSYSDILWTVTNGKKKKVRKARKDETFRAGAKHKMRGGKKKKVRETGKDETFRAGARRKMRGGKKKKVRKAGKTKRFAPEQDIKCAAGKR